MKIFQLIDWLTKLFKLNNRSKIILLILLPLPIFSQNNAFWLGKRASGAAPTNLLLDDYPGAAAAYSVRKLDKDYTGFAMEIRRASDNATQNIGFVGEDLDEVAINSFCSGTTCYVRTWYDQSGNNKNVSQTTDITRQPLIYSIGSIRTKGTKPAIYFSGSQVLSNPSITKTTSNTAIAAFSHYDVLSNNFNFPFSFNLDRVFSYSADDNLYVYSDLGAPSYLTIPPNNYLYQILSVFYKFSASAYRNGIFLTSGTLGVTAGSGAIFIGDPDSSGNTIQTNNDVHEIIYYTSDIGNANRSGIENNINSYYSIY